jgi:hypothetical protein
MGCKDLWWVFSILLFCIGITFPSTSSKAFAASGSVQTLKVRVSWGHESPRPRPYYIKLVPATRGLKVANGVGYSLESGEGMKDSVWQTSAGGGDVDGVDFTLLWPAEGPSRIQNLHIIWADLIAQSDPDTARRLTADPAFIPNASKLTIQMNPEGTKGFTVSADQLLQNKALWVPSLDVFLAAGEKPAALADHQKELASWKGQRVLDRVQTEPEADYQQFTSRWEDMGSPTYRHPFQPEPGHIVGLTWDSAIPKFGIDRGAGVWNDYGNPDHFRFWFDFGDLAKGIESNWRRQTLKDGLPVMTTVFEKDRVNYEVEQFAYPIDGPPKERRGDIGMVLLQKVKLTNLESNPREVVVSMSHRRQFQDYASSEVDAERQSNATVFKEAADGRILFCLQGTESGSTQGSGVRDYQKLRRVNAAVALHLPAQGSREFVVKLPSPMVAREDQEKLLGINYETARATTLQFWSDYIGRGAEFRVPEEIVNDLFRSTLWHALRLPRRHGGQQQNVQIDLPYSNFAYMQNGTPWPVNQAVYVDNMLYDLRGYHDISAEEMLAIYRNNQETNGRLNGIANWVVYTPGMLYAASRHFLLAGDRNWLDKLLPYTLKALDWCLEQINEANQREGASSGLVYGPLNDGTGDGVWAFSQAYMSAGLELFGQVLMQINHPRASECLEAAQKVHQAIEHGFSHATMLSTLVQLRDHTWVPYVPGEALTPKRILDQWYVADVDTGAVHLLRLKALSPKGDMADYLLNDHEDNLFLKGWGMANEPVYNQQATAYLLRDEPKAAIRAFYSYMACAFSHSALEPVEHRWTHGQYFGPPSTDGAWFELYRHMLIHEWDNNTLLLCQATPRKWLENGKKIEIRRAPTYYGPISLSVESQIASGKIAATIRMPERRRPDTLLLRLRHPQEKQIRSVAVNAQNWPDFDKQKEWVRIQKPTQSTYRIEAEY